MWRVIDAPELFVSVKAWLSAMSTSLRTIFSVKVLCPSVLVSLVNWKLLAALLFTVRLVLL